MKKKYIVLTVIFFVFAIGLNFFNVKTVGESYTNSNIDGSVIKAVDSLQKDIVKVVEPPQKDEIENAVILQSKEQFSNTFIKVNDLFALASALLPFAESGEVESQYYLAKSLLACEPFTHDIESSPYESVLMLEINQWYKNRCSGFTTENIVAFGEPKRWLSHSSEGGYGPAVIASLVMSDSFQESRTNLELIRSALASKHPDVIEGMSSLGKNNITNEAWRLLSCDYGHDCSTQAMEWKISLASHCWLTTLHGKACNTDVDYFGYIKLRFKKDDIERIEAKRNLLRDIVDSGFSDDITFEQILH